MFHEIPSSPVLALVIPAVSCCIGPALCAGGRRVFNHVWRGFETIPNGKARSFLRQRKRLARDGQRKPGQGFFAPCHPWFTALRLTAPAWNESSPVPGVRGLRRRDRRRGGPDWSLARKANEGSLMSALLQDYLPLVVFIAVALGLGLALLIAPFLVAYKQPDPEKLSAYECGFNAFDDARMKFDVRFYLVAILFIIFDLEVAFLFPWAIVYGDLGVYGFWSMMVFLAVLTIGFIYEWKKGALEWD
jgi:NADH-quinone oxidoreductase subunit A